MKLRRGWNTDCFRAAVAACPGRRDVVVAVGVYSLRRFGFVLRGCLPARVAEREPVRCAGRGVWALRAEDQKQKAWFT